ncbi:Acetyl-coenzyme A synthetase [Tetrabaena socialis]|uniref:Acetyl-coenzyme A synthetase n=1 Tax=Tetrabaena socialis TaxID=47790 RepID=A0A2J8AFN1_9CHLO|nr:Acetyl-coenzyme A synthetase [Tetrabaena socialis]|eukprot:PNH11330.1 Acetyl-coenzyme A synthetase [Tetrabaena socialis]
MQRLEVLARQLTAATSIDRTPLLDSREEYQKLYNLSISDPELFWGQEAQGYYWQTQGQAIYAFVTLRGHGRQDEAMRKVLADHVRKSIGPFAVPEVIHWAPGLPKTRSGKIMRRVLRKIASGEEKELGDVSTLAEPGVVEMLVKLRGK